MTPQELADQLTKSVPWLVRVGNLDDLEAFRREKLPKWELRYVQHHTGKPALIDPTRTWSVQISKGNKHVRSTGPDEWTARASALVAAAREESK